MIAGLSPLPASTQRSTQLYDALSSPPMKYLIDGVGSNCHSTTLSHFFVQSSSAARSAQNPSGSSIERLYMASYSARLLIHAFADPSGLGWITMLSPVSVATLSTSIGVVQFGYRPAPQGSPPRAGDGILAFRRFSD